MRKLGADKIVHRDRIFQGDRLENGYDLCLDGTPDIENEEKYISHFLKQGASFVTLNGGLVRSSDKMGVFKGTAAATAEYARKKMEYRRKYGVDYQWSIMKANGEALKHISKMAEEGKIIPFLDKSVSFNGVDSFLDAHRHFTQRRSTQGKVVVSI